MSVEWQFYDSTKAYRYINSLGICYIFKSYLRPHLLV